MHLFPIKDSICYVNGYYKRINKEDCTDCCNLMATGNESMTNKSLCVFTGPESDDLVKDIMNLRVFLCSYSLDRYKPVREVYSFE
jgi:hypothetical protein